MFVRLALYAPRATLLAAALMAAAPLAPVLAQERAVVISIRDSVTRQPLAAVLVARDSAVPPLGTTDSAGIARFTLRDRTKRLYLSRLGYAPRWLPLSDASSLSLDVVMSPVVLTLSGVSVEAKAFPNVPERLREFEERRASQRSAVFFTRTDIVKRNTNRLTDLFRGISSVKVVDSAGVRAIASARSVLPRINSTGSAELRYCLLRVVLDGQPKESGYPLDQLEPNDIYGVEVYVGPSTVPSQYAAFGRDANCGVILLWTR